MYFIEWIIKRFKNKKESFEYFPIEKSEEIQSDYEKCEHNFMPVDSTGQTLSCINCGLVVKRDDLKRYNFFKQ